jgi:GIY-YIG catalytic domain
VPRWCLALGRLRASRRAGRPGSGGLGFETHRRASVAPPIAPRGDAPQPEAGREFRPRPEGAQPRRRLTLRPRVRASRRTGRPPTAQSGMLARFPLCLHAHRLEQTRGAMAGGAFLYILLCADGSYYNGTTRADLEQRVAQHNAGTYARGYTATRRPVTPGVRAMVRSDYRCDRSGAAGKGLVARKEGGVDPRRVRAAA